MVGSVEINDAGLDLLTDLEDVRGLLHVVAGDLGDMEQSVHAREQLDESAEVCHTGDTAGDDRADTELVLSLDPGILLRELAGEGNLLAADVLDEDSDFITDMENLLGILHAAPAHLGDVEQAVSAAEIDESTEICDVLHDTVDNITRLDAGKESLGSSLLALDEELAAVADDPSSAGIELGDDELDLLIGILAEILLIGIRNKAGRDEDAGVFHGDSEAALEDLGNLGSEDFSVVESLFKSLVALLGSETLVGEDGLAFSVVDLQHLDLKLVADVEHGGHILAIVAVLFPCEHAVTLAADVEVGDLRLEGDNRTFYDLSIPDSFEALIEHLLKAYFF